MLQSLHMRRAWLWATVMLVTVAAGAAVVWAQDPPSPPAPAEAAVVEDSPDFGPLVTIERIEVIGNRSTAEKLIRRALPVQEGEQIRTGDPRFRRAKFRVMALGYFWEVVLHLDKGSERGKIILVVEVFERGTFTLNRLYLGTSEITPLWAGLDIGDTNLFGSGIAVSAAFVWAAEADLTGAREQWAARLRYSDPAPLGAPLGVHAMGVWQRGSEPLGAQAIDVDRAGGVAGVTLDITPRSSLILDARYERIEAGMGLEDVIAGESDLVTAIVGFERDTRPDPVVPWTGDQALIVAENGYYLGDYEYLRVRAQYGRWFPLHWRRHVLSVQLAGGAIVGDAPRFDRFYLGDLDPLLPPRALDLVVSNRPPPDFFGMGGPPDLYGDYFGAAGVEYSYRLFQGGRRIHGGKLFAGVGLVGLASREDTSNPIVDLALNAGLRLDTEIGVFELSLGNALGRIPF